MSPISPDQISPPASLVPLAYRMRDAAAVSGISVSSLYELAAAKKLALTKVAGRTLVPRDELLRLIKEGRA